MVSGKPYISVNSATTNAEEAPFAFQSRRRAERAAAYAAGGWVEVAATAAGGEVRLSVADTGEGIPAELLGRVFVRFYRVDRARTRAEGGSGIGLTIARAIVEAHGGRIQVESDGPGRDHAWWPAKPSGDRTRKLGLLGWSTVTSCHGPPFSVSAPPRLGL